MYLHPISNEITNRQVSKVVEDDMDMLEKDGTEERFGTEEMFYRQRDRHLTVKTSNDGDYHT